MDTENKETNENTENQKPELTIEDTNNINLLSDKYNLDKETCNILYHHFQKNVIYCIQYIDNEISDINIIHSQTGLSIEDSRKLYYYKNKDVSDAISFFLETNDFKIEDLETKHNILNNLNDNNKENENVEVKYDENKEYCHIVEEGRELWYDKETKDLFDIETKEYMGKMKDAITKIQELRDIVDLKDTILQSQKKSIKQEKTEQIIRDYQQSLLEWKMDKLNKWDNDKELQFKYNNDKSHYELYLDNKIKLKYVDEMKRLQIR